MRLAFWLFWTPFRLLNRGQSYYFDPQDAFKADPLNTRFPKSAETGTFAVFLATYIDVMKLLVTVAAASIAFGGNPLGVWQIVVATGTNMKVLRVDLSGRKVGPPAVRML